MNTVILLSGLVRLLVPRRDGRNERSEQRLVKNRISPRVAYEELVELGEGGARPDGRACYVHQRLFKRARPTVRNWGRRTEIATELTKTKPRVSGLYPSLLTPLRGKQS